MKKTGILLPIFSLPNKYGIGTLGEEAYRFVDFLKKAKQDLWQILPTNPTSYGDSPYQSFSVYAQNPYFIDLDMLVKDKLLTKKDLDNSYLQSDSRYIDYGNIFVNKMAILKKSYNKHHLFEKEFEEFKKQNKYWLFDFAMFMVLKETHNYQSWDNWEDVYKYRSNSALNKFYKEHKVEVETYMFIQFLYARQWKDLLSYARANNVEIVGDMPIYVAYDSVDVWSNPSLFMLDQWYKPTFVAGVPPDYFSATGQLWGNPLYNYEKMKKDGYSWWNKRIAYSLSMLDYVRIDHFRGFSAFYAIPYGSENAINGHWIKGPGMDLFNVINKKNHNPNIIAENLGLLDDEVNQLIEDTNYPGMKILEFEVYDKEVIKALKDKKNHNNILYPGTHDNNTFIGWYKENASDLEKQIIHNELNVKENGNLVNGLIKYCYKFPFDYVIIMMQDVLGLYSECRLNYPGSSTNNWQYRFERKDFSNKVVLKLAKYKDKYVK